MLWWVGPRLGPTYSHEIYILTVRRRIARFESSSLMRGVSGDVLKAEPGVVFRGCRLVTGGPGRHGNRSPDTRTRPRGASLHALRRIMPEPEARTRRPKITTVERREARVPDRKGTRAPRKRPACRVMARQGCLASARSRAS